MHFPHGNHVNCLGFESTSSRAKLTSFLPHFDNCFLFTLLSGLDITQVKQFLYTIAFKVQYQIAGPGSLVGRASRRSRIRSCSPATFFHGDCHEIISTAILSLPLIQVEQLSVSGEMMCTKYWLLLRFYPAQEKWLLDNRLGSVLPKVN